VIFTAICPKDVVLEMAVGVIPIKCAIYTMPLFDLWISDRLGATKKSYRQFISRRVWHKMQMDTHSNQCPRLSRHELELTLLGQNLDC